MAAEAAVGAATVMTQRRTWGLLVVLLLADAASKTFITTHPWAEHHGRSTQWQLEGLAIVVAALLLCWLPTGLTRLVWVYAAVGVTSNVVDSFDGSVANPFVIPHSGGRLAFNLADVYLEAAMVMAIPLVLLQSGLWLRQYKAATSVA